MLSTKGHRSGTSAHVLAVRVVSMGCVASLLVAGILGGLLRAGVAVPAPADASWPGRAAGAHAFLMMFAFMGTVVGIERAVATRHRLAFGAPALSALAGLFMLLGFHELACCLAVVSAFVFVGVNAALTLRQGAAHTTLLLVGAFALLVGNSMFALRSPVSAVAPWWFAFLVLTIAAERLEMTRLMRRRRGSALALYVSLGGLLGGAATISVSPAAGGWLYGASLTALSAWLLMFDIARRTIATHGLSRYMALCLLLGYAWLAIAGFAWMAASMGLPTRDIALHALGLGFVFSMMLGHAPVILPALARIKLAFGWAFYVPLAALHLSLALRLFGGLHSFELTGIGAVGNFLAIALFAATIAGAALTWRLTHHSVSTRARHEATARH